jgi:transcription elongation GreA/GreB family factor
MTARARDKLALHAELVARLAAALDTARAAHAATIEAATHEEARAENDKDTRGLEQSYLARGQAQRVEELATELAAVEKMTLRAYGDDDAIAAGALVDASAGDAKHRYFIAPGGAGEVLAGGVQVVTPRSPLGRALCGRRSGDEAEVTVPSGKRTLDITNIC